MWIQHTDHEWIDSVCRQLSRVTGWTTTFAPFNTTLDHSAADYTWTCELKTPDERIGALSVALPPQRPLDESYLRACEFADLAAQLMQRVLNEPIHRDRLPSFIADSNGHLCDDDAANTWTLAVNRVLDVGLRLTSFRAAALFVLDQDVGRLRLRAQLTTDRQTVMMFGRPLDEAPFDIAALRNQPVIIRRRDEDFSEWLPHGMSLGVCRGISTSHGVQGTLWVFDRRDRRLTPREEVVLDSITARLGDLIEQAMQIEEGALQRRLKAELRIAAESQPEQRLSLQGVGGWCRIAGRTESAREVGGDLCEIIPLGEERMLVAVGDAAGQSIPAAMVMSTVRGALRVIVGRGNAGDLSPEQIVTRLNSVLHGIVDAHQFMTLTLAILDNRAATIALCNAGHPPALLIRADVVEPLEAHGLLLGVVDDVAYQSRTIDLLPGDLLAFYSDGVSEAQGRQKELFRTQGIASTISAHRRESPDQIVEHVWTAMQSHLVAGHPDDRTLLVVRYDGTERSPREKLLVSSQPAHPSVPIK